MGFDLDLNNDQFFVMPPQITKLTLQEALIEEVQIYPTIWDLTSEIYKCTNVKLNAWNTITLNMKSHFDMETLIRHGFSSQDELKKSWKKLRNRYSKEKRVAKVKSKSGVGLDDVQAEFSPLSAKLAFLDKGEEIHSGHHTSSNIDFNVNNESVDVQNHESIEAEEEAEQNQAASQQVTDDSESDGIDNNEDLVQNEPPVLENDSINKSGPPADTIKPAPVEEEVITIRKQLEKLAETGDENGQGLDLLKALSKIKMNLTILTNTRIGMTVNTLRKSSKDEEVMATSKSLIKMWKKFVPESEAKSKEKQKQRQEKEDEDERKEKKEEKKNSTSTADSVRISCRKLLATALRGEGDLPEGVCRPPEEIAELIEDAIFKNIKNTTPKYKNQVRSRIFNLKDKKNNALRENVLFGIILPEKIAVMTSEEMASDEIRAKREAFIKQGIDASQLATVQGTATDSFKCGRCGKRKCTYNQLQTRSADEPMTTFVLCLECGNRWKFC